MICLRKKLKLLLILSFFYQRNIFADIEDQYRNQQVDAICNFENAQFYSLISNNKYCIRGEYWEKFSPSGYSAFEGVLNRSLKDTDNTITKYKIDGDDLVKFSCQGTVDVYKFDCIGPVDRDVIASRGRKGLINQKKFLMNSEFNQTYDESAAYNNRGIKKGELGDYSGAIDDLTMAIKLNPKREKAYNNLGTIKANKGDHSGAIDDYTMAIKLNPNYVAAYLNRGNSKQKLGDYSGGKDDFTTAIKLNPNYAPAYVQIGDYTKAIKVNPNYAPAYYFRGNKKQRLKDFSGAIDDYTMAIKLNPNYIKAYKERGYVKYRLGFYESSCEEYKKIIRLGELEKKIGLWGSNACKYLKNSKRGYFDMR